MLNDYETCDNGHRFSRSQWANTRLACSSCPWCAFEEFEKNRQQPKET